MRKMMIICLAALAIPVVARAMDNNLMISGYVDGEFQAQQGPDLTTVDPNDTTWKTSFGDASHAVFWATGNPSDNVSFKTEVYYWQNNNQLALNQANLTWSVMGDKLGVDFGKFYFPFGIEARSRYATTNKLVTEPSAGNGVGIVGWADNGIDIHGMMKMNDQLSWSWSAAVSNGRAGTNLVTQTTDANNNNKTIGGRVEVMPMGDKLNVGGSVAYGAWDAAGDNKYILAGGHAILDYVQNLDVRGEFYWQDVQNVAPTSTNPDAKAMAFYAQGAYRYPIAGMNYIEPVVRFGWMDPNTDVSNDSFSQIAVGVGFSPVEHFTL